MLLMYPLYRVSDSVWQKRGKKKRGYQKKALGTLAKKKLSRLKAATSSDVKLEAEKLPALSLMFMCLHFLASPSEEGEASRLKT